MVPSVGPAGGVARPRGAAEGARGVPGSGRVPAAEAQASRFTAGRVRRLPHERGLRPRVPRSPASAEVLSPDEGWLHDLARALGRSPHTLHRWRKKGWLHVRQVGGRGGSWAVGADASELARLRALEECPRSWTHRERLAALRVPGPRRG